MLTQNHIMRCYEEGLTLHLLKRHVPQICLPSRCLSKGYFVVRKAVVILPHVESFDDLAVTVLGDILIVSNDNDGAAFFIEPIKYFHDLQAGL